MNFGLRRFAFGKPSWFSDREYVKFFCLDKIPVAKFKHNKCKFEKKTKKKNDEKPVNGVFENEHREQTFQRISQHCKRNTDNTSYYENKRSLKP